MATERNIPIFMLTSGGYQRKTARIIANSILNLAEKNLIPLQQQTKEGETVWRCSAIVIYRLIITVQICLMYFFKHAPLHPHPIPVEIFFAMYLCHSLKTSKGAVWKQVFTAWICPCIDLDLSSYFISSESVLIADMMPNCLNSLEMSILFLGCNNDEYYMLHCYWTLINSIFGF